MPAGYLNYPNPTHEPRQLSLTLDEMYLTRFTPPWSRPASLPANTWRGWVLSQPVAMVCRETLIANLLSLDWKITPRNSKYREELEPTIKYYTKLFVNGGEYGALGLDYTGLVEWIAGDLLDTPFGGAGELGRRGDTEEGRVIWIRPLDAGTLFPTLNEDFPVVQYYQMYDAVAFPSHSISRTFMSPHSFIMREGWGMAPPEKIYFALELLNRGDKYYANLLLDIPTAGILDLGDMEKDSALEWVTAFKTFVDGTSQSFRIPVLYEHNNPVEFISLGKVPNDIMFDKITMRYAALVAAAYGMSLSDIGLQTTSASGETLAGSIRQERRTRKTGFARIKSKVKFFFDHILPETLEFNFIDYDDELNVALGRARLASSQAFTAWRQIGLFSPQELRSQAIQDGLVSITMPDEIPPDAKPDLLAQPNGEPELMGSGKPPSGGGEGEIRSLTSNVFTPKPKTVNSVIDKIVRQVAPKIIEALSNVSDDEIDVAKSIVAESFFQEDDVLEVNSVLASVLKNRSLGTLDVDSAIAELKKWLEDEGFEVLDSLEDLEDFKSNVKNGLNDFIGKSILFMLNDVIFEQNMFDGYTDESYNNIVQIVKSRMEKSLPDFAKAHVEIELQKLMNKIRMEN